MNASMKWAEGMKFICDNHGLKTTLDASTEHGGANTGPTPKELVLNAMMGCTAMDVMAMLKKMRQEVIGFEMEIAAEKTTQHPIHFKSAVLNFRLNGSLDSEKVIKAVDSSLTKYCGVNYMISKSCEISFKVFVNGAFLKEAPVKFIEPQTEDVK
jgi:putative redox protein